MANSSIIYCLAGGIRSYHVKVGDNVLRFDASLLTSGMNIVRVTHGNTIIHSAKVNVLN